MEPCGIGKKFIAELLGTFFLVFFGTGSAVITLMISESVNPNNVGIGILGGLGDWIAIALAFGLTVMVCIYLFICAYFCSYEYALFSISCDGNCYWP